MNKNNSFTSFEERLNIYTHGFGLIMAIVGSSILLKKGWREAHPYQLFSYIVYCIGLVSLYLASTMYHASKEIHTRKRLNIFDHSAIYLLIAGTYTPITLLSIKGIIGGVVLVSVWLIAITGIILKQFFIGRFSKLSTLTYVLMGWIIIFAIQPLIRTMSFPGLMWLLAGGISYTIGAIFYQYKSKKYNHPIFHVFVLLGSLCHYIVILNYTN